MGKKKVSLGDEQIKEQISAGGERELSDWSGEKEECSVQRQ